MDEDIVSHAQLGRSVTGVPKVPTPDPGEAIARRRASAAARAKAEVRLDGGLPGVKDIRVPVARAPEEKPVSQGHRARGSRRIVLVHDDDGSR